MGVRMRSDVNDNEIQEVPTVTLFYKRGGVSLGSITLSEYIDGKYAFFLWVEPKFRNKGVARALLDYVLKKYGCPIYLYPEPIEGVAPLAIVRNRSAPPWRVLLVMYCL